MCFRVEIDVLINCDASNGSASVMYLMKVHSDHMQ